MDFRDSPEEAEFRSRLRSWLADHNPGLPASSTDDEYWARQAEWHTALYDAGFFGLSWPTRFGGHDLPSVFDVILDDGVAKKKVTLNRSYQGLLITRMVWREIENFSGGGVCLVLASMKYAEDDYFRTYDDFNGKFGYMGNRSTWITSDTPCDDSMFIGYF